MEACAGLHIRSGRVPRCPRASAKHSAASEDVIPPNHRELLCVVWQICIIISMEINENHGKINENKSFYRVGTCKIGRAWRWEKVVVPVGGGSLKTERGST